MKSWQRVCLCGFWHISTSGFRVGASGRLRKLAFFAICSSDVASLDPYGRVWR